MTVIITNIGKQQATTGLKKTHTQNRNLGNIQMLGTAIGWRVVRGGESGNCGDEILVSEEEGENICPHFLQPLLVDRRNSNYGSRELIPIFHNPRRKI